jgi:hypothetical protein
VDKAEDIKMISEKHILLKDLLTIRRWDIVNLSTVVEQTFAQQRWLNSELGQRYCFANVKHIETIAVKELQTILLVVDDVSCWGSVPRVVIVSQGAIVSAI